MSVSLAERAAAAVEGPMHAMGSPVGSVAVARAPLTAEGLAKRAASNPADVKSTFGPLLALGRVAYSGRSCACAP